MDPGFFLRECTTKESPFQLPFLRRLTEILQPRLMFYFNTNKRQSFFVVVFVVVVVVFVFPRKSCSGIRKPQVTLGEGAHPLPPSP